MLQGYRTYITLALLVAHQILKLFGVEIADTQWENFGDVILLILAAFFRAKAQPTG